MRNVLFLLFCFFPLLLWGQRKFAINSSVGDYITHGILRNSLVELLTTDSVLIDSTRAGGVMWTNGTPTYFANFSIVIPNPGDYLLRVSYKGYETLYKPISISKFHRREVSRAIPPIYLKRAMEKKLKNVTVTATKIKFYNKGDTVVYNADAFQLGEGSMLDALVRQLPGVEFKDGQIYVNGKFVSSLLLNGKDFFKGNNQIMLDNLPAYMVNTIKVYDQESEENRALKIKGKKETVMDVNLKKQYNQRWLGNIESGGGTSDRYLGRAFLLRSTDHSQLSFFGNINNLNDTRKPGQNTEWTPDKLQLGLIKFQMAGVSYSVNDRNKRFNVSSNALIKHMDRNEASLANRTNFLSGGNTYDRAVNSTANHDLSLTTNHNFTFTIKKDVAELYISPGFEYNRYNHHNNSSSATASTEYSFERWTISQLDSLYMPSLSTALRSRLLNRNIRQLQAKGWNYSGSIMASLSTKVSKYNNDNFIISFAGSMKNGHEDGFTRNRFEYLSNTTDKTQTDFLNQYIPYQPGKGTDYSVKAQYRILFSQVFSLTPYYKYGKSDLTTNRTLYRLEQLQGWGENTLHALGMLPSEADYFRTLDHTNSFWYNLQDGSHEIGLDLWWNSLDKHKNSWWVQVTLPVTFHDYQLKYKRNLTDTLFHRRTTLVSLTNTFLQWDAANNRHRVFLQYSIASKSPDMTYLMDIRDTSDPLNITNGNKYLKNSYWHYSAMSYRYNHPVRQISLYISNQFSFTRNAIAMRYDYNKGNGVRSFTPVNVNGNWSEGVNGDLNIPLNKKKTLTMRYNSWFVFDKNVDLATVEGTYSSQENKVRNLNWWNSLNLKYQFGKNNISVKAGTTWVRVNGTREDFKSISAVDYKYGLLGVFDLPWKLNFSTDLVIYSRRGYEDSSMNTNDIVWNARLSYPVLKGKILLMLDGFDILNQLSNIQRTFNAQGRTEVRTNVIPHYVMFHAVYRFNFMPKKKK